MPPTTKKISAIVPLPIIRQIEDSNLTQTESVKVTLRIRRRESKKS